MSNQDDYLNTFNDKNIDIKYCEANNLYYIKTNNKEYIDKEVIITCLLSVEKNEPAHIPQNIQDLIEQYKNFKEDKEEDKEDLKTDLKEEELTGKQYLDNIQKKQAGACRHRAVAFIENLKKISPEIASRYINNKCHAYAEIQIDKQWIACDFGGYSANINIKEPSRSACIISPLQLTMPRFDFNSSIPPVTFLPRPDLYVSLSSWEMKIEDKKLNLNLNLDLDSKQSILSNHTKTSSHSIIRLRNTP